MENHLSADTVFLHGKIVTVDPDFSIAEAVAVRDGKILAVGKDEEVLALSGAVTQKIDLRGCTLLPGINDSHIHLSLAGIHRWKGLSRGEMINPERKWTKEELRQAYLTAMDACIRLGVTSVTDGELGPRGNWERGAVCGSDAMSVLNDLHKEGKLSVRINLMVSFGRGHTDDRLEYLTETLPESGWHSGFGDQWLRISGLKLFADGSTGTKTACTYENCIDGKNGTLAFAGESEQEKRAELEKMICFAHRHGFQVGIHVCGDKAADAVADAFIKAQAEDAWDSRDYFIHGDLITEACIERIKAYSFGYSAFIPAIWEKIDALDAAIGEERSGRLYPLRKLLDAGVVVSAHTDDPFTFSDWREGMQCCILRQPRDRERIVGPEERISVEEAIRIYTINGAWQTKEEHIKGSIEVGKLADFCVLADDILSLDPHKIKDIPVVMTVVGGKVLFDTGK